MLRLALDINEIHKALRAVTHPSLCSSSKHNHTLITTFTVGTNCNGMSDVIYHANKIENKYWLVYKLSVKVWEYFCV